MSLESGVLKGQKHHDRAGVSLATKDLDTGAQLVAGLTPTIHLDEALRIRCLLKLLLTAQQLESASRENYDSTRQDDYSARWMALDVDARQKTKEAFTFEALKEAALILWDRLAKDSAQPQRKYDWLRMAYVLVAAVSPQYPDKLAFPAAADIEDRLRHATELFAKQSSIQEVSKKITSAVDESFSRRQKEYFFRPHLFLHLGRVVNTFLPLTLGALITTLDTPGVAPFPAFGSSPWPYLITYVLLRFLASSDGLAAICDALWIPLMQYSGHSMCQVSYLIGVMGAPLNIYVNSRVVFNEVELQEGEKIQDALEITKKRI
ncbi:hypothetical protein BDR05DRAFT_1045215 [Suillus weaverae]|nr:hypothetical protein BDR05DRAFT_1045215 [Suillus weaverae]